MDQRRTGYKRYQGEKKATFILAVYQWRIIHYNKILRLIWKLLRNSNQYKHGSQPSDIYYEGTARYLKKYKKMKTICLHFQ